MLTLAHVINPIVAQPPSDLAVAQPVTFASMRVAREFSKGHTAVQLYAVAYPEDVQAMPNDFIQLPWLQRSVLDLGDFPVARRLPLLVDVLSELHGATDADYLIYTNVDIGLQPHFYQAVAHFINAGHDAFVINRRTIPNTSTSVTDLPYMWAEVGKQHPGWDCFIFQRDLFPRFDLGHVCLGAPRVGLAFLANLVALARGFYEFTDVHLTFHLGDDQIWRNPAFQAFDDHNTREAEAVLQRLENRHGRFPRYPDPHRTPPGDYLLKRRLMGRMYLRWAAFSRLPLRGSRRLRDLLKRRSTPRP